MKSLKFLLAFFMAAVLFNVAAATEARAQLMEIMNRMEAHQKSLQTLRSKVRMEIYNAQLQESDVVEGTTIYLRGTGGKAAVRIDWTKPFTESLALVNGQYIFYRPRLRQAIVGKIDEAKENVEVSNALLLLNRSKKEIKANFAIIYLGTEKIGDGTETAHLKFTPKKAAVYQSAELWLNRDGMPIQAKVWQSNGDSRTVLLSDFKKNEMVNIREFRLNLPKNTTVVKGDSFDCACFKADSAADALENWSDVVFSGEIVRVKDAKFTFKTDRVWKGIVGREVVVQSLPVIADCKAKLTFGKRYIVFAEKSSVNDQSSLNLMPCSLTTDLSTENAGEILRQIGDGKPLQKITIEKKRPPAPRLRKRVIRKLNTVKK